MWDEGLGLMIIVTNCKLAFQKLQFQRILHDDRIRLLLRSEISDTPLNLNSVRLLFKYEVVGAVDERREHGTLTTTRVSYRQNDVLVLRLVEFG